MEQALYRKYRPQSFEDVLGQEYIVNALKGALQEARVPHAFLFFGSRGTGKTSLARIFARSLGVKDLDLYEIDAASNRGIDDVRALRESVHTLPFDSPYKCYVIDECHMLTREAFNALLKTLEEPPEHAIFILATTEQGKVPETVISRCETHHFKKPGQKALQELVLKIAKKEGFKIEEQSAELIAMLGDGSYRDTLGILQKVLRFGESGVVNAENVEKILGAPSSELVRSIINAIVEKDIDAALFAVRRAAEEYSNMHIFANFILRKLRLVLLLRFSRGSEGWVRDMLSEEDFEFYSSLVAKKDIMLNSAVLLELISAFEAIPHSVIPELPLELALIKLLGENKA